MTPNLTSGEEALKVAVLANPRMICEIPDSTLRTYLATVQTKEKMNEMKAYTSWKEYSERNLNERERFDIETAEFAKEREGYEKQQEEFRNPKKGPATNPRKRPADAPSDSPPSKTATQDGNLLNYFRSYISYLAPVSCPLRNPDSVANSISLAIHSYLSPFFEPNQQFSQAEFQSVVNELSQDLVPVIQGLSVYICFLCLRNCCALK